MDTNGNCESCSGMAVCECLWICGRGPTRLACQLRTLEGAGFELELRRNTRVYAVYRFVERLAAMAYAARMKYVFEGNGWTPA